MGITVLLTPGGNPVRAYCAERTLCDLLKTRSHADVQVIAAALRRYMKRKKKDVKLLSEYARALRVAKKLGPYLEALL